jgi:hypothetical protein
MRCCDSNASDAATGAVVIYADHLSSLIQILEQNPSASLAYSGVRHHYNRYAVGAIEGFPLQLVQVIHRAGGERWTERQELVTDDLHRMFWSKLESQGPFLGTERITCEWVDHPDQRHRIIHRRPRSFLRPLHSGPLARMD